MKRINLLDMNTSNKIAAGEVVERPFSVVKELVENSIDAGSKNISVEIADGGEKSIKVIDDGDGIHPEDIEKALLPHATSKIRNIEDVFNIRTMGFRGEALASIAAISRTTLTSRTKEHDHGRIVRVEGGNVKNISDAGCNVGTSITVEDLFYNVPARQKFLKSIQREASSISDIMNRLALANAHVCFKFASNGKNVMQTAGNGNEKDVIRSIYGKSTYENVTYFEGHSDTASVHGYIGNAEISRGSRNNQSIFVNNRYIKSKLVTAAVENAFKSFLTVNKFPFFVLFIEIYPEFVDVNVHPTKAEVKFRDDRAIFKLVFDAVHDALRKSFMQSFNNVELEHYENGDLEVTVSKQDHSDKEVSQIEIPLDLHGERFANKYETNGNNNDCREENAEMNKFLNPCSEVAEDSCDRLNLNSSNPEHAKPWSNSINAHDEEVETKKVLLKENRLPKFPSYRIVGQFHSTYVIAEHQDELFLIDQHAAHEKVLFEKYRSDIRNRAVVAQLLIVPVVMELSPDDFACYLENEGTFASMGFVIELFGENTISIREVPLIIGKPDVKNLFIDMLDNLKNMGTGAAEDVKYDKIASLACKSAVKANDSLSEQEMKSLVEDMRYLDDPFTCPHGRPTIIKFTLNELEKKFKRIQ